MKEYPRPIRPTEIASRCVKTRRQSFAHLISRVEEARPASPARDRTAFLEAEAYACRVAAGRTNIDDTAVSEFLALAGVDGGEGERAESETEHEARGETFQTFSLGDRDKTRTAHQDGWGCLRLAESMAEYAAILANVKEYRSEISLRATFIPRTVV
ncbi:hypothetical protein J8273_2818 [Carpediemonas membranifera]|uniref:Uncharacterized protein n=1 Tax=Carpediemonas membranifera TaxID=201153 RepID=A0A8J6AW31_9EUKA|nr:hypothetical protein J8273_2818 [Carpediemonas membranifera]|eukprot:KAG9395623.1 hypothetical protein J8273_2818 [Carpediemonas membranifera]